MFEKCPNQCRCRLSNMNIPLWVDVSCSEANMSSLPEVLPPNTQILNVSYNRVCIYVLTMNMILNYVCSSLFFRLNTWKV